MIEWKLTIKLSALLSGDSAVVMAGAVRLAAPAAPARSRTTGTPSARLKKVGSVHIAPVWVILFHGQFGSVSSNTEKLQSRTSWKDGFDCLSSCKYVVAKAMQAMHS